MSDIVERIRARPKGVPRLTERLLDEAADEIERLQGIDKLFEDFTGSLELSVDGTTWVFIFVNGKLAS